MKKALGFTWDASVLSDVQPRDKITASIVFYSNIFDFVRNDLHLDKTAITDKDLRTLYQDISVGGYAVYELERVRNDIISNQKLYDLVAYKDFDLNQKTFAALCHACIGEERKSLLDFDKGVEYIKTLPPYEGALVMGAFCLKRNFYRRQYRMTALQLMNGWLMQHGFEAISIPPEKLFELQAAYQTLHSKNDATDMIKLFDNCRKKQLDKENIIASLTTEIDAVLSKLNNDDMTWVNEYREMTFIHETKDLFVRIGETFNGINIEYDDGTEVKFITIPFYNICYQKAKKLLRGILIKLREINVFNNLTSTRRNIVCGESFLKDGAVDYDIPGVVIPQGYRFVKSLTEHQYRLLLETPVGWYQLYEVGFNLSDHAELSKPVATSLTVYVEPTYLHKKAVVNVRLSFFMQLLSVANIVISHDGVVMPNMGFLFGVIEELSKHGYHVYMPDVSKVANLATDRVKHEDIYALRHKYFTTQRNSSSYRLIISKDELTDDNAYQTLSHVS